MPQAYHTLYNRLSGSNVDIKSLLFVSDPNSPLVVTGAVYDYCAYCAPLSLGLQSLSP